MNKILVMDILKLNQRLSQTNQEQITELRTLINTKTDRVITGTLPTGIPESGTKGAAQIFGPLTTTLTFNGHWSQQRQGLGPKYELEIYYNNKGKVLKIINARLNVAGNMGSGVSWGHKMPLAIMNYENEPYLVLHTYFCQSWLGLYFDIDGIGNSSISNFKTVLQTELSEITEPTITIENTTAD